MNDIQIFNNPEFGDIRIVIIDNEPWFVGKDVAAALGYGKERNAIQKYVDKEDALKWGVLTSGGKQDMTIINESGLYALVFGSKLDGAKKFKHWVTSEVLPTIRKTGHYGQARLPITLSEQIQIIARGHGELKTEISSVKKELEDLKNDMPILGIEEVKISNAVKKKGVECLGGKKSNAYNDKSLRGRLYSDLHKQLRREFGVNTYKAIKRNQADTAIAIIQRYEPPLVLSETIETVNLQQKLDIS